MKLLYVAMDASPYAGRSHEILVAEEMAKENDVTLVCERWPTWGPKSPRPDGITSVIVDEVNNPQAASRIVQRVGSDFDAAFASSASGAPILAEWKKASGKAAICQALDVPVWRLEWGEKGPWFRQWEPWFKAMTQLDRLIVNTSRTLEDVKAASGFYQHPVDQLPPIDQVFYGVDTERCDQATGIEGLPPASNGWALTVGRLVFYRGVDLAIHALRNVDPRIRPTYGVVGVGDDAFRLAQTAQILGVETAMLGGLGDLEKYEAIKASKFGLCLSWNPNVPSQFPLECLYAGRPCIVADVPMHRERCGIDSDWKETNYYPKSGLAFVDAFDSKQASLAVLSTLENLDEWSKGAESRRDWIRENRSFQSHARGILACFGKTTKTVVA